MNNIYKITGSLDQENHTRDPEYCKITIESNKVIMEPLMEDGMDETYTFTKATEEEVAKFLAEMMMK